MKDYIKERVLELAQYILNTKSTVRKTAIVYSISKSTISYSESNIETFYIEVA